MQTNEPHSIVDPAESSQRSVGARGVGARGVGAGASVGSGASAIKKSEEHLRLIAAFHYAFALLTVVKLLLGLPFLLPGIAGFYGGDAEASASAAPDWFQTGVDFAAYSFDAPVLANEPTFIAFLLMMTGLTIVLVSVVHGAALFWIGRCIQKRRKRKTVVFFCWMDLMYFPFGTVLSIAFLIVHRRPGVRELFDVPQ